ncbi:hypothetical protein JCM8097_004166 [Rhodosporidiobolus ruineniae]
MHLSTASLALLAVSFASGANAASTVKCASTSDCSAAKGFATPANAKAGCNKARGVCVFSCNTGYTLSTSGTSCVSTSSPATTTKAAVVVTTTSSSRPATATAPNATPVLKETYSGQGFLDKMNFWTAADPTHGQVNYVSAASAKSLGLTQVTKSGTVLLSIDRTSKLAQGQNRNSVRLSSKAAYQPGQLIIADLKHAPVGCSVWGAYWLYNYPWPQSGEIDIYEGVNLGTKNSYTLHTAPGCTRSGSLTGSTAGYPTDCNAGNANSGCTVSDPSSSSFGAGFNAAGGGVFALLYAETGISIWRWPRASIPSDVKSGKPRWKGWGTPVAQWSGTTCDTRTFFANQLITFDITTCGDWAGQQSVWQSTAASGKCYSSKYPTCSAAVADPANFKEAYFEVNYVKVFSV